MNKPDCIFCYPTELDSDSLLHEDEFFYVKCDDFPVVKGHILIIPKEHVSCIGAYSKEQFQRFTSLYQKFGDFIDGSFGSLSSFEHGIYGQTVFHSHVHLLPFEGTASDIVSEPEGYNSLATLGDLTQKLEKDGGYLYFKVGDRMLLANPALREPRFFRDRYAKALEREERKNWREVIRNSALVGTLKEENREVVDLWHKASTRSQSRHTEPPAR